MMNRRLISGVLAALAVAGTVSGYLIGHARAAGAPSPQPLTYSGTLTDQSGAPLAGQRSILVALWDLAAAGNQVCATAPSSVTLAAGTFALALPDACASAAASNPNLWVEVTVDGTSLGRSKLGAVPYALEAQRSVDATGDIHPKNVLASGNIGVGTTTPAARLDVTGDVRVAFASTTNPGSITISSANSDLVGGDRNGNLHLDAISNPVDGKVYLNFYSGNGVAFADGAGHVVATVDSAGNYTKVSDGRAKEDVEELRDVLEKIDRVRGVSYRWKRTGSPVRAARQREIGVIAQEVAAVFPEAVTPLGAGANPYQGVDYNKLTAVLVQAVRELHAENRTLAHRLAAVETGRRR
jgi:hypothetical protein